MQNYLLNKTLILQKYLKNRKTNSNNNSSNSNNNWL